MKKIICLILALLMIFSVVSCTNAEDPSESETSGDSTQDVQETELDESEKTQVSATESATDEDADTEETATQEESTAEMQTEEDSFVSSYDGVFQTGYDRVAITPSVPIGDFIRVENDIYATCLAVHDGDKTIMLVSIEVEALMEGACDDIRDKISSATKVPERNIFITVTHNHSAPSFGSFSGTAITKIARSAKRAVEDLSDTKMYIGTGKTTGMAFVRSYVDANGNYAYVNPTGSSFDTETARCVSEADDTVQVVRFVREDKKDIIATNWQAHHAHAIDAKPAIISSDVMHYIREDIEAGDDDALVIYLAGASGNINFNPPNYKARKYRNYIGVAHAFAEVVLEVSREENLTRIQTGKINIEKTTFNATHEKDTEEEIAAANRRIRSGSGTSGDRYLVSRNRSNSSKLRIAAVSFGGLAFITAPYEMFDNNGVQIKTGSPFEMTVIITNSDGAFAYMPSYEACTIYGGYETEATYFATGVAEELVAKYVEMLEELNGKS